jgi:hypothetical protein
MRVGCPLLILRYSPGRLGKIELNLRRGPEPASESPDDLQIGNMEREFGQNQGGSRS